MRFKLVFLLCLVGAIEAWSHVIHRAVADDVQSQLTPKALQSIQQILGPLPLSYWADWADKTKQYPKTWHFVSVKRLTEPCVGRPKDLFCALTVLSNPKLTSINLSESDRIRLLLHLVVDAHQPLHVDMEGFANPRCKVRVPNVVHLHQWMDREAIGVRGDVAEVTSWIRAMRMQNQREVSQSTPDQWLLENAQYWPIIYPPFEGKIPHYCSNHSPALPIISEQQMEKIASIVLLRLSMASHRLAYLLNTMYG